MVVLNWIVLIRTKDSLVFRRVTRILVAMTPRHMQQFAAPYRKPFNNFSRTDTMSLVAWLVVGLVAGVLASLVMGGTGYGIIGDIVIGIVGAFIGGWLFANLGISTPMGGMGGTIFVAFIGAVVLLFILRLIRGSTRKV
jgi:uncharacterized membrane protein YeaQ/YmgE (transglycosylase-associated protein family)